MTKTELNKYKEILKNRQAELAQDLRNREGIQVGDPNSDPLDEVQHAGERDLAIRNLDRESDMLRDVKSALRRIDEGSYGICERCEEDISQKRLTAVPWTPYCIHCQEQRDDGRQYGTDLQFAEATT